jgi:hypothetical protein
MGLTVTGAVLGGERVGLRCEDGRIAALGPEVAAAAGDETIEAAGAPLVADSRDRWADMPRQAWLSGPSAPGQGAATKARSVRASRRAKQTWAAQAAARPVTPASSSATRGS